MKICFYCDSIFSFGGVQRVLAVIAKALSAASHEVTILTLDNPAQEDKTMYELQDSDIRLQYIRFPALRPWEYFPSKAYSYLYKKVLPQTRLTSRWYGNSSFPYSLRQILINRLNEGNYDVVVGVHAFLSLRLASVRKQLNAPRVIGWMHNSYQAFFENQPSYLGGLKNHFAHQMRRLDDVVVLTHTDASLYSEKLGLSPSVIYNPLTLVPQGRSQKEAKKFLTIGRMSPYHKGFDILIEGFALFARQNSDWTLDIVGEGPEEEMLRGLIAKHRLEKRIKIYPFTQEIQKHYASASAYVLSSRWEGFPLVLGEAMSHGLPIIASDLPVVKEVLSGKENGFIFSAGSASALADALLTCTTCPSLEEMGNASLRESESMQLGPVIQRWEEILSPTPKH